MLPDFIVPDWPAPPQVRALARDPDAAPRSGERIRVWRCDLPDAIPGEALDGARLVIHCAYVTRHNDLMEAARVNETGTRRLIEATRRAGANGAEPCSGRPLAGCRIWS